MAMSEQPTLIPKSAYGAAVAYVITPSFNLPKYWPSCDCSRAWAVVEPWRRLLPLLFLPLVRSVSSFLRAFSIWLANDCEVVIWPPATEDVPEVDDSGSQNAEVLQAMMHKPA